MTKSYREFGKQAEDAVRSIKDKELRREAFRILFLQFMAGGDGASRGEGRPRRKGKKPGRGKKGLKVTRKRRTAKSLKRPGRRGGSIATIAVQKLIDSGSFRKGRDAAEVLRELAKKHVRLNASQLRMVLMRFARGGKLKRRVKMKGRKVTYLYATR